VHRIGVGPLQIELLHGGECFRGFATIEDVLETIFANGIKDEPMLIAEELFLVLISKPTFRNALCV
jgi:hypothetical protein